MSKISKFIKLDKNVLCEYIYNEGNLLSEPYNILINSKDRKQAYMAYETSGTGNTKDNQLFEIDPIENKWGKVNDESYNFLQLKNYSSGMPIRHDILRFHLPVNWTFGEYYGFKIRVYAFDTLNQTEYDLSNFYFDMTDVDHQDLLNFSSPPLLFQEKLWGKTVQIEIPGLSELSAQLTDNLPSENSINAYLTSGNGFNSTSPIFIEFSFIEGIQTINDITTFLLQSPISTTVPQTPEYEKLGLKIENSPNGDFFEIYGMYNGTIAEFKKFIDDSVYLGNSYYVQYNITMYEQNIRGKTTTITLTDSFNEPIEYRPIIKYSTTTAIIDVEMRLIDEVDNTYIMRRASYGMLQDEVSKYSLYLLKINLKNAYKPKVYNIKTSINPELVGVANSFGIIPVTTNPKSPAKPRITMESMGDPSDQNCQNGQTIVEKIKIPYPVLIDRHNIMAKSENAILNSKTFLGYGKIQILLYPFDNVVNFVIATGTARAPKYLDMSSFSDIKLVIKNDNSSIEFDLYEESGQVDLVNGIVSFKISQSKFYDIKKIYLTGINAFYITGSNSSVTSVIYTGLYKIYDDKYNIDQLNIDSEEEVDPEEINVEKETVIVSKRKLSDEPRTSKKQTTRAISPKESSSNSAN